MGQAQLKVILSIFWVFFTFSFVLWWWVFSLYQTYGFEKIHRMFFWEGLILLPVLIVGGVSLVYLTFKDFQRNQQLHLFFSNFTHDIKTSITRLRLQMDLLEESSEAVKPPGLSNLMQELARLDLQLENSLFLAKSDNQKLWREKIRLSEMISVIKSEWPELEVQLDKDAELNVDKEAMKSILRNLFQNSIRHGQASQIQFKTESASDSMLKISILDNGRGLAKDIPGLGREMIHSSQGGNGLGLYLACRLVEKMRGRLEVQDKASGSGYAIRLEIPGKILGK
jgi:signal transduction histidine kinase